MRSTLQDAIYIAVLCIAQVYIAFTSVAIYFQLSFVEPSWAIRTFEACLGFLAIGCLWIVSLGILGRDRP